MQYRVTCASHSTPPRASLGAAMLNLSEIVHVHACTDDHIIEAREDDGDTWHVSSEWLTHRILDARLGEPVRTLDGELVITGGGWGKEATDRADAIASPGSEAWTAALGRREHALLTEDGRGGAATGWCECPLPSPAGMWVRYEKWTAQGRVAHGYLCPTLGCRGVVQTG